MNKRTALSSSWLAERENETLKRSGDRTVRHSIANVGLDEAALDPRSAALHPYTFSLELETGKITSQNKSGRCWLFAGLNTLRYKIMKDLDLENFELSQSYQMFYDKLEKANYFLENILETLEEPLNSRLLMWLLKDPLQDGGQWDMFTALVEKYGVVPKYVMPETYSSSNSGRMNETLTLVLRGYASDLRNAFSRGETLSALRREKARMIGEFYRLLTLFLGIPPAGFVFEYVDRKKKFHRDPACTPREFCARYIGKDLENYISVINAPTADKPFNRTFTVRYLGNVEGGKPVKYLNVDMPVFRSLAVKQLKAGTPVWFGSDVGKKMKREAGILDENVYDYEHALGIAFGLDKGGRLDYGESLMTHAMVLTGVNLVDEAPNRWKVENSWGDKNGKDGYFVMSDAWFEHYVYQLVIHKKHLSAALLRAWESEPLVLEPWDPMGSLA